MRHFQRVCVYCGSHDGHDAAFRSGAEQLGQLLAERRIELVYGGGNVGLMGRIADAVITAGGRVTGVIPRDLQERELAHAGATELLVVESMHERKARMADAADAFIAMPGGIGTLEELFETYTWLQLGFHDKPLGLLNVAGFYDGLLRFLDQLVESRFLRLQHRSMLAVDTDPARLLDTLARFESPRLGRWWPRPEAGDPR
jgi:uncharacterized protein (TIGR00730 family)